MARLLMLAWLSVMLCSHAVATSPPVTLDGLLREMTDVDAAARWPEPAFTVRQASGYDRRRVGPGKPGWFENDDGSGFDRAETTDGRAERVWLDVDGPGAIVRFFVTSPDPKGATIRVYLDNAAEPTLTFADDDLFTGPLKFDGPLLVRHPPPLGRGGSVLYLPVPYAKHCKVTLQEPNPAKPEKRYFQIDYRTYPQSTPVDTFDLRRFDAAKATIDATQRVLAMPSSRAGNTPMTVETKLAAGEQCSIDLPNGPHAIRQIELDVGNDLPAAAREQALRSVVLRADFDDAKDAIWCPVGDFTGSGTGGRPLASFHRTVDPGGHAMLRWTMPFRSRGVLTLHNVGTIPAAVKMTVHVGDWAWDDRSMHFHATWHAQAGLRSLPLRDWNYLTVDGGRGVLVGDVTSVFNPLPAWYGEGDEKIYVDGEPFPSTIGTGVEDYYNASWAPNPVYQGAFAGQPRIDGTASDGNNVYTRARALDAIPFTRSLRFDWEIMTWRESAVDYAVTTYWYGAPGATPNHGPDPTAARRPVRALPPPFVIAGAVECESMTRVATSDGLEVHSQDMRPFAGQWSGDAHLLVTGRHVGDFVELAVPAEGDGPRRLTLFATKANDYGIVRFSVNGQDVAEPFDGYSDRVTSSGPIALGIFTPRDGRFVVRIEIVGVNEKAVGAKFLAGLDALRVSEE